MRALGKITPTSYDYRDQAKLMSKLVGDVSFMGGMMRKMQKGIDDANQNFVQQLQSMVNDFFVLLGGGGDTGLDFGDLKYILQAIGALFGFDQGILPINLFDAAWHFFSNYIFPVDNFQEVINVIIDQAIATVLDLFGEIPIVGQALQQLAVIISTIRDTLSPVVEAIDALFSALGGDFSTGDLGSIGELWDTLVTLFSTVTAPIAEALAPLWPLISEWTVPIIEGLTVVVEVVTNIIDAITGGISSFDDFVGGAFNPVNTIINLITALLDGDLIAELLGGGILDILPSGNLVGTILSSIIPGLDTSKIVSGQFAQSMITNLVSDLASLLSNIGTRLLSSIFNTNQNSATNLILDPTFENTTLTNNATGAVYSTDQFHSGTHSIKVTSVNGSYPSMTMMPHDLDGWDAGLGNWNNSSLMKVQAGQKFYVEVWVKAHASNTGANQQLVWEFVCRNSVTNAQTQPVVEVFAPTAGGAWTKHSGYVTIPSGYDLMWNHIYCDPAQPNGNRFYFDDAIMREETQTQNIISQLFGGTGVLSSILASVIPGLDTSKIISGTFAQSMVTGLTTIASNLASTITNLFGGSSVLSQIIAGAVPGLDTSKIITGNFAQSMITNLVSDLGAKLLKTVFQGSTRAGSNLFISPTFDDTSIVRISYNGAAPGVYSTTQKHSGTHSWSWTNPNPGFWTGLILAPNESNAYITASVGDKFYLEFWLYAPTGNNHAAGGTIDYGAVFQDSSGVNADQFNTGSMALSSFTKGSWTKFTFHTSAVPAGYDRVMFNVQNTNTVPVGNVYYIDDVILREETATQGIIGQLFGGTGVLSSILASVIPGLDTSKIITGTFGQSMVTNLISDLGNRLLSSVFDNKMRSGANLAYSPTFEDSSVTRVQYGTAPLTYTGVQKHGGSQSLTWTHGTNPTWDGIIFTPGNSVTFNDTLFPIRVDDKYYIEAWIFPKATNTTTGALQIGADLTDSLGVNGSTASYTNFNLSTLPLGQWTKVSSYVTGSSGRDRARFWVQVDNSTTTGNQYYIDDVVIREVTEPQNIISQLFGGSNILSNILASVIPGLDTSKIITGNFAQSMVSNLVTDLGNRLLNSVFQGKTVAGSNLVIDPSFEDTSISRPGNGVYSTAQSHSGTRSIAMTGASAWEAVEFNNFNTATSVWGTPSVGIKMAPGQKFYGELWVYPKATNTKPSPGIFIQATIVDSKGVNANTVATIAGSFTPPPAGVWTKISGYCTIPAGYDSGNFTVQFNDVSCLGDTFYFDDPVFREETAAANIKPLFNNVDILSSAYDYTQTLFTGASQAAQNLLDSFAQKLGGVNGSSLPIANYQQVALNTANTIASSAAAIASMQQKLNQSPTIGGLSYLHDFSLDANSSSVHSDFVRTYSGAGSRAFQTLNGSLQWVGGSGGRNVAIDLNTIVTTTDYQLIGISFASDPGSYYDHPNWWTSGTWHYGYQWITGRMNAAGTQYVRVTMRADGYLEFGYQNGGSYTVLDTKAAGTFNFYNGVYYLACGTTGNIRTFQLIKDSAVIWSFTDGSAVTALGASNRRAGTGEYADDYVQGSPIRAFLLSDNTPAVVTGSCARFYRASVTAVSSPQNIGGGAFPNSFFDTTDYKTSDITWTPASGNSITVSLRGTYVITVHMQRSNAAATLMTPCVLVNGTPKRFGGFFGGQAGEYMAEMTCAIALQPNDVVQPGYFMGATQNLVGASAGNVSYVEITKVGAI